MVYEIRDVTANNPPKVTKHLNRKILCGCCNYKCCNSGLLVKLTESEVERMQLPQVFEIAGHCQCLGDHGCVWGADRPVFCKIFPLVVDKNNNLCVSHWCTLHCPSEKDFVLDRVEGGQYVYKRREGTAASKKHNTKEEIRLNVPLEEFPNVLDMCSEGLKGVYGDVAIDQMKVDLASINKMREGFGL